MAGCTTIALKGVWGMPYSWAQCDREMLIARLLPGMEVSKSLTISDIISIGETMLNEPGVKALRDFTPQQRKSLAIQLLSGIKHINTYVNGICYETVAFVVCLLGRGGTVLRDTFIANSAIRGHNVMVYRTLLQFKADGQKWIHGTLLPFGTVIGFFREGETQPFHTAIGSSLDTGHAYIRSINGLTLSACWNQVNLNSPTILRPTERPGFLNYSGSLGRDIFITAAKA